MMSKIKATGRRQEELQPTRRSSHERSSDLHDLVLRVSERAQDWKTATINSLYRMAPLGMERRYRGALA